jgi:hypothetical protein
MGWVHGKVRWWVNLWVKRELRECECRFGVVELDRVEWVGRLGVEEVGPKD